MMNGQQQEQQQQQHQQLQLQQQEQPAAGTKSWQRKKSGVGRRFSEKDKESY
jgi:hypothetical protein